MARNNNPSIVPLKTRTASGRTDRAAHKVAKAGATARKKLVAISRRVKALKRQLQENTEGLRYDLP
jgi:hypothetical protein